MHLADESALKCANAKPPIMFRGKAAAVLDSDTKSRIDSARDILVGKVPDPKSQVEQITIALIYKFMDDMDRQEIVERIPIPLPTISKQRELVIELEAERALVEANRELIARFEKKIQSKLAEVWGDEVP
jgi:hypothetical protein